MKQTMTLTEEQKKKLIEEEGVVGAKIIMEVMEQKKMSLEKVREHYLLMT